METFWSEVVMKQDEERLREEIQVFRIIKPKVSSKVMVGENELGAYCRMVVRMKPGTKKESYAEDLQEALTEFARRQGWKVQVGTPPRTKKERTLLETLNKAKGLR